MRLRNMLLFFGFILCGVAIAQDATPVIPVPTIDTGATNLPWWVPTLSNVVSIGFMALLGWVSNHVISKHQNDEKYKTVIDALKSGIENAHNTMREAWNKAAADSVLTSAEKAQLREQAWTTALANLEGPTKDLLLSYGKDWAFAKIRDIIAARKAKA